MRDYVKFVYAGTQLGGSNREKLDKLTALREKLENYSRIIQIINVQMTMASKKHLST
jgi:hypothetical protein